MNAEIKLKDMTEEQIADLEAQIAEYRKAKERKPLAWNTRAENTCHLISRLNGSAFWFECDKCGGNSLHHYPYCPHCGRKVMKNGH